MSVNRDAVSSTRTNGHTRRCRVRDNKTSLSVANYNLYLRCFWRQAEIILNSADIFPIESGRIRHRVQFYEYFKPRLTQIVFSATRRRSNLTSLVLRGSFTSLRRVFHSLPLSSSIRLHIIFIISSIRHLSSILTLLAPTLSLSRLFCTFYTCARIHLPFLFLSSASTLYLRECHRYWERVIRRSLVQKHGGTIYNVICGFTHCCRNRAV